MIEVGKGESESIRITSLPGSPLISSRSTETLRRRRLQQPKPILQFKPGGKNDGHSETTRPYRG